MPIFDSLTKTQPAQLETFTITMTYDNTTDTPRTIIMYAASVAMSEGPSRLRTGDLTPYLTAGQLKTLADLLTAFTAKATTEMIDKPTTEPRA